MGVYLLNIKSEVCYTLISMFYIYVITKVLKDLIPSLVYG